MRRAARRDRVRQGRPFSPIPRRIGRNCVPVPGGAAVLGTNAPMIAADFEGPVSRKTVRDLWWEVGAISVAQFRRFVAATGYVTVAERLGCSFVFHTHVPAGPKTLWAWLV